jgi:acyl carrier protein
MHNTLREFITDQIMKDPEYQLTDDEPLITGGMIHSIDLVMIQLFIEEQFGVLIPDIDMTVETANTINDIVHLITQSS